MAHEVVADADRPRTAIVMEVLESSPRFGSLACDRPVNEIEVDVIEAEPLHALVERAEGAIVSVVVVPQLRRHEDLVARDAAGADRLSDVALVVIEARGVDMAISELECGEHGIARLVPGL